MKICILSMQRVNNMGSLLQAYALKSVLEKLNNEVEFIDIVRIEDDYKLLGEYKQDFHQEIEKTGVLSKLNKIDRYFLNRIIISKKNDKQKHIFEDFRIEQLEINKKSKEYELCIIGSDEVFNCLNAGEYGFTSQLFGNVKQANAVITYAVSCGSTRYNELPAGVAERIRKTFKNILAFSVRDRNTYDFTCALTDKQIGYNLDPVLVFDFSNEIDSAEFPALPEHYCIVYSYYNRIHTKDEINAIKLFCKKHQLVPVSIGAPQFWIKDYITCNPFECLKIFKNADFVITDTFHGTIFSAKYASRFAVITRDSNYDKLYDLLIRLGIEKHLIKDLSQMDTIYKTEKEQTVIDAILKQEREKTISYLRKYINGAE